MTPYGKFLFSQGKFNPHYYTFYDSDILYDGNYGGITEDQNTIVERVQETERPSLWSSFEGAPDGSTTRVVTNTSLLERDFSNVRDANAKFFRVLGQSSPWSDYYPAWSLNIMSGSQPFSGTYEYKSLLSIPSLSATLEHSYKDYAMYISNPAAENGMEITTAYNLVKNEKLLLDVQELNTIFKANGNYDIEVFRIDSVEGGPNTPAVEEMTPLGFVNTESPRYDFLLEQADVDTFANSLAGTETEISALYPRLDNKFVEYFLSIRVDDEIEDIPPFRLDGYGPNLRTLPDICED